MPMKKNLLALSVLSLLTAIGTSSCGGGGSSSSSGSDDGGSGPTTSSGAPVISSAAQASVTESSAAAFFTLEASDPEGDPITMALLATSDASAFAFNAATGELSPLEMLDYETPLDANEDNIYQLTFEVSDDQGNTRQSSLAVSVEDVRDEF